MQSRTHATVIVACLALAACRQHSAVPETTETRAEKYAEVVESFGGSAAVEPSADVRRFFDRLRPALDDGDAAAVLEMFDVAAMLDAAGTQVALPTGSARKRAIEMLQKDMPRRLADPATGIGWVRYEIRAVRPLPGEPERVMVYSRHWDAAGITSKLRWWLVRDGDRFRAYDFENLDLAMRTSTMIGVGFQTGQSSPGLLAELQQLLTASQSAVEGNVEPALATLEGLDDAGLPPVIEAFRLSIIAGLRVDRREFTAALTAAERAWKLNDDMPYMHLVLASCHTGLGRYEQALGHAEDYAALLGKDADYYVEVGDAQRGRGEPDLAEAAYRAGLADDRQSGMSVLGLLRLLPPERRDEVLPDYRALEDLDEWFAAFAERLLQLQEPDTLRGLIEMHEGVQPDDENLGYYRDELAALAEGNRVSDRPRPSGAKRRTSWVSR